MQVEPRISNQSRDREGADRRAQPWCVLMRRHLDSFVALTIAGCVPDAPIRCEGPPCLVSRACRQVDGAARTASACHCDRHIIRNPRRRGPAPSAKYSVTTNTTSREAPVPFLRNCRAVRCIPDEASAFIIRHSLSAIPVYTYVFTIWSMMASTFSEVTPKRRQACSDWITRSGLSRSRRRVKTPRRLPT